MSNPTDLPKVEGGKVVPIPPTTASQVDSTSTPSTKKKSGRRKRPSRKKPRRYAGDLFGPEPLPDALVVTVQKLEKAIGRRVWLLLHTVNDLGPFDEIDFRTYQRLMESRRTLPAESPALLIDSLGGSAEAAFRIATLFRRACGGFDAYVPRYAKSAATLLCLGADKIFLGKFGELGPLDVQHTESARKEHQSALNEKQALDRLHAQALSAFDNTMFMLTGRLQLSGEEFDEFIPTVLDYVAKEFRPLFEKVDVVHWTKISRLLRIGHDYAFRLLQRNYDRFDALKIANSLVEAYPDHGFAIDIDEAKSIGLKIADPSDDVARLIDDLVDAINNTRATGFIKEIVK